MQGKLLISLSSKTKNACFIKSLNFGNVYIFERIFNDFIFECDWYLVYSFHRKGLKNGNSVHEIS